MFKILGLWENLPDRYLQNIRISRDTWPEHPVIKRNPTRCRLFYQFELKTSSTDTYKNSLHSHLIPRTTVLEPNFDLFIGLHAHVCECEWEGGERAPEGLVGLVGEFIYLTKGRFFWIRLQESIITCEFNSVGVEKPINRSARTLARTTIV